MDNIKNIERLFNFFQRLYMEAIKVQADNDPKFEGDYKKVDLNEANKRDLSSKAREKSYAFINWYEKNRGKQNGINPSTKQALYDPMPSTTGDPSLADWEVVMMPVFQDFNRRNVGRLEIEDLFEGYLKKIREGWKKKLEWIKGR